MTNCQVLDHNNEPVKIEWAIDLYFSILSHLKDALKVNPWSEYEMEFPDDVQFTRTAEDGTVTVALRVEKGWKFKHWSGL